MSRFDESGVSVRHYFGQRRHYVARIPGQVEQRTAEFPGGVAIYGPSMWDALKELQRLLRRRHRELAL